LNRSGWGEVISEEDRQKINCSRFAPILLVLVLVLVLDFSRTSRTPPPRSICEVPANGLVLVP
jgi:hypothetical protein